MKYINLVKSKRYYIKQDINNYENIFRKALIQANIKYQTQKTISKMIVDFFFPKRLLVVEIDGGYHKSNQQRDYKRDSYLKYLGYRTIRFTNYQVEHDLYNCILKILDVPETNGNQRTSAYILTQIAKEHGKIKHRVLSRSQPA